MRRAALACVLAAAIAALAWLYWPPPALPALADPTPAELPVLAARGEYVFRIAGCRGCHTQDDGVLLAGGRALDTPFGTLYPPNITPDVETGIGSWRAADLLQALRNGRAPDGRAYLPAFPYTSYAGMRAADVLALYAYLRTVPPVSRRSEPVAAAWYLRGGLAARAWQRLFFVPAAIALSETVDRGRYIATALGHCAECHTPRDRFGVRIDALSYSGTDAGPDGEAVPNITPHREDGIGRWRASALREFLASGMTPDGDFTGGAMTEVVDYGTQYLTPEDAGALVAYLRQLPAVASTGAR